jgi:IMP cyclohydrolase
VISSEDIENFDDDKKVVDYNTLASFFTEQIQSGSKYWKFCYKTIRTSSCLDDKNSYVGYYEIDDIMSFDSFLKEQGRIIKVKRVLDYSMSQITQIVSNNGKLLGVYIWSLM